MIWSAAICGAAVFTGCVDTADNKLDPMEQEWERVIRRSYPGHRTPKTMPPAVRDSVVYYGTQKAAQETPAPAADDPASAVDAAANAPAVQEVPAVVEQKDDSKAAEKSVDAAAEKSAPEKAVEKQDAKAAAPAKSQGAKESAYAVVKPGDTIGGIAKEFYGNAKYSYVILKANPQVKNPKRLKIGTKLVIPAL